MTPKKFHVTAMGAALVDVFAKVSDAQLLALNSPKGAMTLIDTEQALSMLGIVEIESKSSGGSAANTIAGIAAHGHQTAFIGKVGEDDLGNFFMQEMLANNIAFLSRPLKGGALTGRCIVLITPDAERTMHTLIGAAATTSIDDLDLDVLGATACFFAEGYVLDSPCTMQAFHAGATKVKATGGRVAFSLSDSFCVARHIDKFNALLVDEVDLLLGNEAEAKALFGCSNMADITAAIRAKNIDAVITRSEKGALIIMDGKVTQVPAIGLENIVDLTGAGDQFAAGFLSGLAQNKPAEICGQMGAIAAAEVMGHIGSRPLTNMRALFEQSGIGGI